MTFGGIGYQKFTLNENGSMDLTIGRTDGVRDESMTFNQNGDLKSISVTMPENGGLFGNDVIGAGGMSCAGGICASPFLENLYQNDPYFTDSFGFADPLTNNGMFGGWAFGGGFFDPARFGQNCRGFGMNMMGRGLGLHTGIPMGRIHGPLADPLVQMTEGLALDKAFGNEQYGFGNYGYNSYGPMFGGYGIQQDGFLGNMSEVYAGVNLATGILGALGRLGQAFGMMTY